MAKANLVVKTNYLNNVLQNLSLIEVRLIQLAIIDARESGNGLTPETPLRISAERYATAFNTSKHNAYKVLSEASISLLKRYFSFINPRNNVVSSNWVSQIEYLEGAGAVELIFTPAVVQGISRIDGAVDFFTKYLLSNTIHFKSVYSVRLYELLAQWKNSGNSKTPVFELEIFRGQLGIEHGQYRAMKDLKKYVLDKAVDEINQHSDLIISYQQQKHGRIITGFSFEFKKKPQAKSQSKKKEHTKKHNLFIGLSEQERIVIETKIIEHIKRLESKGEAVSEWHKENISKKAVAERWGLEDLEVKIAKEPTRQAQLAKKLLKLKQQEQKEMKKQEKAEFKQKHQLLKDYFESLEPEQQEKVLDAVEERISNRKIHLDTFKRKCQENKAHEHPMFVNYFFEVLNL